jgi:transcriptional regulator with XRE-family HTH domain
MWEYYAIRIKEEREEQNMTQKFLAEKVGVTQQTISNIENGVCSPSLDLFIRITKALKTVFIID